MSTLTSPTVAEPVIATAQAADVTEELSPELSEERLVHDGRLRRLQVIRHTILIAAGLNIATVFGPWWNTTLPAQRMRLFLNGERTWVELGEGFQTTSGLAGGELTRVLLVALVAGAIWYAMGKLWWFASIAVMWASTPPLSLAPPSAPPASRLGARSHLADMTTDTVWLGANRVAFFALLALTVAAGVQGFRVRRAAKAVEKSEGRPAGIWEKHVLPKLAEAGVSLTIDPKSSRSAS